jgi:hypothetical protein
MTALFRPKFSITSWNTLETILERKHKFKEFEDKACMSTTSLSFLKELGMSQ